MTDNDITDMIARLDNRLARLERERESIINRLYANRQMAIGDIAIGAQKLHSLGYHKSAGCVNQITLLLQMMDEDVMRNVYEKLIPLIKSELSMWEAMQGITKKEREDMSPFSGYFIDNDDVNEEDQDQ